jgi:hypothetical protein
MIGTGNHGGSKMRFIFGSKGMRQVSDNLTISSENKNTDMQIQTGDISLSSRYGISNISDDLTMMSSGKMIQKSGDSYLSSDGTVYTKSGDTLLSSRGGLWKGTDDDKDICNIIIDDINSR